MMREVREVNEANGWFDAGRTVGDGIALLHSEVSEALEAFRSWGTQDATGLVQHVTPCPGSEICGSEDFHNSHLKPEGIGSELADVLVRLLDECDRQDVSVENFGVWQRGDFPVRLDETFGDALTVLHRRIAQLGVTRSEFYARAIYDTLTGVCEKFGVDLRAEFDRKLAYNRVRGYRHGGRGL